MKETLILTFSPEFAEQNDIVDYYIDVNDDDEQMQVNVYVDDVDDVLVNKMNDDELCDWFGMDSTYLLYTNRSEFKG